MCALSAVSSAALRYSQSESLGIYCAAWSYAVRAAARLSERSSSRARRTRARSSGESTCLVVSPAMTAGESFWLDGGFSHTLEHTRATSGTKTLANGNAWDLHRVAGCA